MEDIWTNSNEVDEPRTYYTEWSQKEKDKYHILTHMRNAGLEEAQVGIKIARRNINNLKYADLNESERQEWKSWLKAQH